MKGSSNADVPGGAEDGPTVVGTAIRRTESSETANAGSAASATDVSTGTAARRDAARALGWCFFTTLDHVAVSDSTDVWSGSHSVLIQERSTVAASAWKVNALWQAVDGTPYRGSRLQFSVRVKGRGGVFVFLQAATERELLLANNQLRLASSSNKYFASIGDNAWIKLDIVSEIRAEADIVYFGIAHNGSVSLWVDDVRVTEVGPNSPITSTPSNNAPLSLEVNPSTVLAEPTNLDFELISDGTADAAPNVEGETC